MVKINKNSLNSEYETEILVLHYCKDKVRENLLKSSRYSKLVKLQTS